MKAAGAIVAQGLAWWGQELVGLLPRPLRPSRGSDIRRALVRLLPDATLVEIQEGAGIECHFYPVWQSLSPQEAEPLVALVQAREVSLCVPDECTYRLQLTLPAEARSHIRQAVQYQLTALAPLDPGRLLFDISVDRNAPSTLNVDCVMVRADYVDQLTAWWTSLGLLPPSIGWAGPEARALDYTFQRVRGAAPQGEQASQKRLAMSLCAIVLAAPLLIWGAATIGELLLRQEIERLSLELRPRLAIATERARLAHTEARLAALLGQPQPAAIIEALARSLPEKAWIERFQFNGQDVQVQGLGADGGEVTLQLQQAPLLRDAQLQSTSTDMGGAAQFRIRLPLEATSGGANG